MTSSIWSQPSQRRNRIYGKVVAASLIILIPYIHIGVINKILWVPNKRPVNKTHCRCDCFDTVFKGSYETLGKTTYKNIYFNATFEMLIIWVLTLGCIILSYETFKRLYDLYYTNRLRWLMFALFALDIYPNYYSFWMFFNYTNDGYYEQFNHQLFFTISELFSTWNVLRLCSKDSSLDSWSALSIICVSTIHILLGGVDQFFEQLILWRDQPFQRFRNLGFVLPDVLHIVITVQLLAWERGTTWTRAITWTEHKNLAWVVSLGFILGKFVFI